ncbi:MAG: peptide chain release factor N(5)-glutamine methyltransferase [Anaerolineae bacterium]|nr:peptide chain release factor N(5)-glutamine methyltransferase [Anaerolineae bacterium]
MCCAKSVRQALADASGLLSPVTGSPRLESQLLLAHVLKLPRIDLLAHPEAVLDREQEQQFTVAVQRRVNGEPLPYITGSIEFFGHRFHVTPDVLIPRPETEMLVELTLAWLAQRPDAVVVDVGTGSGCIAVAVAAAWCSGTIIATDLSYPALRVAYHNAEQHHVAGRTTFINCDLIPPVRGKVDAIVSNPPYISQQEQPVLPRSLHYEPYTALFAGSDGLHVVRRLLHQAGEKLKPDGLLLIEIGAGQGKAALHLAQANFPTARVELLKDLSGLDRVIRVQCGTSVV